MWRELARNLIPGVAFHSDRLPFEALVRVASKMRHNLEKFKATDMACADLPVRPFWNDTER